MNKKLSRIAAIALSAAMVTSAFAMSTGSAFAAVSREAVKATLGTSTYYLAKNETQAVTIANESIDDTFLVGATYADASNAAVTGTVDPTNVKITNVTGSNATATQAANGDLTVTPASAGTVTGDTQVTLSGFTVTTSSGKVYDVSPVTVDVKTVDKTTYSYAAWSNEAVPTATTLVSNANVGQSTYLTDVKVNVSQTGNAFATLAYTKVAAGSGAVAADTFVAPTNTNIVSASGDAFIGAAAGTQSVAYYDFASQLKSASLTVNGAYSDVTAVTKPGTADAYTVSYGAGVTATLTAAQLASATLNVKSTTTSLDLNTVDTKIGTVIAAGPLTVQGGKIGTLTSTAGTVQVIPGKADMSAAVSVDTITAAGAVTIGDKDELADVTVGSVTTTGTVTVTSGSQNKYALGNTKVNSIKADNVTVSNKKTVIGAIAANTTAGTVTVAPTALGTTSNAVTPAKFAGVSLPALSGYVLTIKDDATVASVAAPASTVDTGKTLTVSGKAAFTGAVTGAGTIAIAPASLTITPDAAATNAFTLALTQVQAGATAFNTAAGVSAYSVTAGNADGKGDFANIITTGYYAVTNKGATAAVIDKNIDTASIKDATTGTVSAGTNNYTLEIGDGEVSTLAVQPYPANTLSKGYYVQWTMTGTGISNFTLGAATGLTTTVTAPYSKYVPTNNNVTVTAQLMKGNVGVAGATTVGDPINYTVNVVASKTAATTDFTLTPSAPYIKTGSNMTVTIAPNGSTALGGSFAVTSSDSSTAVVGAVAANNTFVVAGAKNGKATLTVTWTKADGTTEVKTLDVFVTSTPVVAYIDGKVVTPSDSISVVQSTTKNITFITAGDTFTKFSYIAGNDKVMQTRAYSASVWNGTSGEYGLYMNGKVGTETGVYVNGQLICKVKVADRPFKCDTTTDIAMNAGKTYSFKITPAAGTAIDSFTFNTARDAALSTQGFVKNADGTVTCKIKAVSSGAYGVYVTINGQQYKVFAVTVK